jgi:predicted DNA-binding transcriptional regulator AlpA
MTQKRILRRPEQAAYLGMSEQTLGRISRTDPTFPKSIAISPGISGRDIEELDRWIASRPRLAPGERGLRGEKPKTEEAAP